MSTALAWRGVTKEFGSGDASVQALRDVTLEVAAGEMVAVMGPSGSGKSTLLHLAGGLDVPTAGTVTVGDAPLAGMGANALAVLRRRDIGYVFQRLNLVPSLTALENVMLPLELDGAPRGRSREQARAALARAGIDGVEDRFPDDMSGGEQQRVALARAVVGERKVVLADEPTGALDTTTADQVIELLASLASAGAAVVLVTHEPRFASWADRIVLLRDGAVVDETTAPTAGSRS